MSTILSVAIRHVLLPAAILLSASALPAQAPATLTGASVLQQQLDHLTSARASAGLGHTALYALNLSTGSSVGIDSDTPVQTASVIKLAILYHAMVQIRDGQARWDEPITLHPHEAVAGSGLLTFLDTPITLTLKDILTMMVIVSDNTATNLAIDRFGIDPDRKSVV